MTDPLVGRDLLDGQFRILEKIGSGGMSAVYTAIQTEMSSPTRRRPSSTDSRRRRCRAASRRRGRARPGARSWSWASSWPFIAGAAVTATIMIRLLR
jgi:hypothetical protein